MTEPDLLPRHQLAQNFVILLVILFAAATLLRPLLVTVHPIFTYLGVLDTALAAGVYLLLRSGRAERYEAAVILTLGMICIVPMLLISGGVNSQFSIVIPLFPLIISMLGGVRLTLVASALLTALTVGMMLGAGQIADLTGDPFNQAKSMVRGVWTLLGVVMATYIGVYYRNLSDQMAEQLKALAGSDHLTGLANRRTLEAALDRELARLSRSGTWLSLLMLDVDHFKAFNDRYGHRAGDLCLQDLARCLEQFTRQGQDLVARYGGEEFVVMLTDTAPSAARAAAEKLRQAVAGRPREAGAVTVTIGIASAGAATLVTRDELVHLADRALYAGKAAGRNRCVHVDDIGDAD